MVSRGADHTFRDAELLRCGGHRCGRTLKMKPGRRRDALAEGRRLAAVLNASGGGRHKVHTRRFSI